MSRTVGYQIVHVLTIAVFLLALLLVNGGGILAVGTMPSIGGKHVRHGEYFAYSDDLGSLEQDILYFDINGVTSKARNADILFIGNSRMQMGWDIRLVRKLSCSSELKIYNLSCGNSEGITYFSNLFMKNNIRNKVVVVNIDKSTRDISIPATNAMRGSWLTRMRSLLKKTSDFHSKAIAESFLPESIISYIDHEKYYTRIRATILRDANDGFWIYRYWGGMNGKGKICSSEKRGLDEKEEVASSLSDFMRVMSEMNNYVILIQVPSTDSSPEDVTFAQRITGRESLLYSQDYTQLHTFDDSHLNLESATRFTNDMLPRVISLAQKHLRQSRADSAPTQ